MSCGKFTTVGLSAALSLATVLGFGSSATAQQAGSWDKETLDLFASLPVQDQGRIKPLNSLAGYTLLGIHGKRTLTTLQEEKLGYLEWLLEVMFFPQEAEHHPLFRVTDSAVVEAIGVSSAGKKRSDRYSFEELRGGLGSLSQQAMQHMPVDSKQRTRLGGQLLNLHTNVNYFQRLSHALDFASHPFHVHAEDSLELNQLFGGSEDVRFSDVIAKGPELLTLGRAAATRGTDDPTLRAINTLFNELEQHTMSQYPAIFPPDDPDAEQWLTAADLVQASFAGQVPSSRQLERLRNLERLWDAVGDWGLFQSELETLHQDIVSAAEARGDYENVALEVTYYRADLVYRSEYAFLLGFLVLIGMWFRPRSVLLYRGAWGVTLVANVILTVAIVMRCIIRARPPVSTLYETILFITAIAVAVALFMEWITKKRVALSAATILGALGVVIANKFEGLDGIPTDTMPVLQAVLDTNFWLATHVTAITVGYAAGLLAAGLGSFYLLARFGNWAMRKAKKGSPAPDWMLKGVSRMTYGVICFGLLFSVVGTILGGIWANDSWGRFWGWDPKENGALLICITCLVVVHGRMSGLFRDFGVCATSAFGGIVVAFSWWHVNQLGVGLHSYGFTEGVLTGLNMYYGIQGSILALGSFAWFMEQSEEAAGKGARGTAPETTEEAPA